MSEPIVDSLSVVCPVCTAAVGARCINVVRTTERKQFPHPARTSAAIDAITDVLTRDMVHEGDARMLDPGLFQLDTGRIVRLNGFRITITGTVTLMSVVRKGGAR